MVNFNIGNLILLILKLREVVMNFSLSYYFFTLNAPHKHIVHFSLIKNSCIFF